jgi:hypothetical protein
VLALVRTGLQYSRATLFRNVDFASQVCLASQSNSMGVLPCLSPDLMTAKGEVQPMGRR